jgi:hypothetical protein
MFNKGEVLVRTGQHFLETMDDRVPDSPSEPSLFSSKARNRVAKTLYCSTYISCMFLEPALMLDV